MDLTKLWSPDKIPHFEVHVSLEDLALQFMSELKKQVELDLCHLRAKKNFRYFAYYNKIRVLTGNLKSFQKKKIQIIAEEEKCYLFLQLPGIPGFLIESTENKDVFVMYRATLAIPFLHQDNGENRKSEIFVLKSKQLEEFRVLDEGYVRTGSDKTLSLPQTSELLLMLAESVR